MGMGKGREGTQKSRRGIGGWKGKRLKMPERQSENERRGRLCPICRSSPRIPRPEPEL
ncbi:unnamed protein product [Prunus armeniaca]|uniref:Uncharacterized protein n=1 Tax=Prunus armeniaca TaxID=36596 RepID=A0A6J5WL73_PRUAR|nr:unnamed protein product [Prunus armeniaca]CAB4300707.1 unnamed protein product [Prunus armeniaca]